MTTDPNMTTDPTSKGTLDRLPLVGAIMIHAGAIVAPLFFTWQAFVLFIVLSIVTGQLGISLGFHRLLAHQSFKTTTLCRRMFATFGTLALQAGPMKWIAIHRLHHRFTDTPNDPHTPRHSFVWAHFCWTFFSNPEFDDERVKTLAKDVGLDPFMVLLEKHNFLIGALFTVVLYLLGSVVAGIEFGVSCFLWGGCARIVYIWHTTFLINSLAHSWGYRNYAIANDSRNSLIVAILAPGDGWHNNHHAFPRSAAHGHRFFELDPIYWFIMLLKSVGLVTRVVEASPYASTKVIPRPT